MAEFVDHDNGLWLHGAIGYLTPGDFLAGRAGAIRAGCDRKREAARALRAERRVAARELAAA